MLIERIHKRWLLWALKKTGGNKLAAARMLGISQRTFRNWEINFGIRPKAERSRPAGVLEAKMEMKMVSKLEALQIARDLRGVNQVMSMSQAFQEIELALIELALHQTGGNRNAAARILGLKRTALVAKMKKYGILELIPSPYDWSKVGQQNQTGERKPDHEPALASAGGGDEGFDPADEFQGVPV